MGVIGTVTEDQKPTDYLSDLEKTQRYELGNAGKMISEGYSAIRRILIGTTDNGKIVNAQEVLEIITNYANRGDIEHIVDQYQMHPEDVIEVLKLIGYTDEELNKKD